jgi:hypothetical protein
MLGIRSALWYNPTEMTPASHSVCRTLAAFGWWYAWRFS